jgi:GNAT superfamily N-acetyltransferase
MSDDLKPVVFDPQTADAAAWRRFHVLRRMEEEERRPDDPVQPDDEVEARMKKPNPYDKEYRFEISRGGTMLSSLSGETVTPRNPEYETNKHLFWAEIYVRPELRRQGIASRWLPVIVDLMDRHGCTVVGFFAETEAAHGFLKWMGAAPKLSEIESRLKLSELDWAMVERWTKEGAERSPQTTLEVYEGALPDNVRHDFATQITTMLNTMPMEDLDIGKIIITPERMKDWEERQALVGQIPHTVLTREPDGVISGITDVTWAPYRRTLIHQNFTGVLPSERGRGLGKWIKAAMLLHMRETYPDAQWVVTSNAHSNDPMLKINRTLGFKAYRSGNEYQISRDGVEARLRSVSV